MPDGIQHNRRVQPPFDQGNLPPAQQESRRLGKEEFLKLLTAQLRLQNPLEPMNNENFIAQLAQFSQVEQLVTMKNLLEQQIQTNLVLSQSITNLSAASLIGNIATVQSSRIGWNGQPVSIGYRLPLTAAALQIQIQDSNGIPIRTFTVNGQPAGDFWIEWDGKDDAGNLVAHGTYTVVIEAKAGDGSPIQIETFSRGKITAVRFTENGAQLRINGINYQLGEITEITAPE